MDDENAMETLPSLNRIQKLGNRKFPSDFHKWWTSTLAILLKLPIVLAYH